MEITQRKIVTGGFETFFHETGADNQQTLLLLHGSGPGANAISNWQFALPFLGETYHCLAPDIAGFGESPCDQPPTGAAAWIDVWVQQMIDFLDALGLEKVCLVGNSMGGGVSLHLVDRYPERFERIVLMGAVGAPFTATEGLKRGWGYYNTATKEELAYLVRKFLHNPDVLGGDVDEIAETRFKFVMQDAVKEQFVAMFPGVTQAHIDAFILPPERLAKMEQPFMLTHGREDFFIPLSTSYYMEEHLPNAQLHVFSQCGHWIQIEQRKSFNNIVKFFFDGALDQ
ncbi:MAG: alpha/beta hydrolase [Immundisolibacteraceae bacterium]|nr:alpha/beta hydrolase [Immundisolibacteraceae bacterium]